MRSLYLERNRAPVVHLHWRRFAIKNVPFKDAAKFDAWLLDRWREKDDLIEQFNKTGIVANELDPQVMTGMIASDNPATQSGYLETEIGPRYRFEFLQAFLSIFAVIFSWKLVQWLWWAARTASSTDLLVFKAFL